MASWTSRAFSLATLVAVSACDCDGGGTGSTTAGFRTAVTELDFGVALEGTEIARGLEISATGRADVVVEVGTADPFSAPETISIPGGSAVDLIITFTAGVEAVERTVTLTARGESFEVKLRGEGVRPLACTPTAQCRTSQFVLETRQCEESIAADGDDCAPSDICLENGVCKAGECLGTARSCSDGNACTQDACSSDVGCVNVDVSSQCPRSSNPCIRSVCDADTGCGLANANDESICGSVDCVTAHLCAAGTCKPTPTPEGFLCLPATPCQGEGRCTMGSCVRPDAGVMTPSWSVPLGASPPDPIVARGSLQAFSGNVYLHACALTSQDGGCALLSYTSNGFLRFERPTEAGATLHAATPFGVVLSAVDEVRAYALAGGAQLWATQLATFAARDAGIPQLARNGVALSADGGLLLALSSGKTPEPGDAGDAGGQQDAGTSDAGAINGSTSITLVELEAADGGARSVTRFDDAGIRGALALTPNDDAWLYAAPTLSYAVRGSDGGWSRVAHAFAPDAGDSLSIGSGGARVFYGGARAAFEDGGITLLPPVLGATERASDFEVLSSGATAFVFFDACRPPKADPCLETERQTWVRAFHPVTGATLWEAQVLPGEAKGQLIDAALTGGALAGAIATLTQADLPMTGPRADLQLFVAGKRAILCPLEGTPRVGAALFDGMNLYVLVDRAGTWKLEAYALNGTGFQQTGWPRSSSTSGTRRER